MRHSILIMLAGCTIVLFLVLRNCAPSMAVIERASADGRIRLAIPKNALPRGIDPATIRIVALNPATIRRVTGLGRPRFAYRLEPEGLKFLLPVQLSMNTAGWHLRELPLLLHRSAKGLEALNLEISVTGTQLGSVSAPLQHFSEVLGFTSAMSVDITDPGDQHVDTPIFFNISAGVRPAEIDKRQDFPNNFWTRQRVANPVRFSTGAFIATGTITPDRIANRPSSTSLDASIRHTEFETFECTEESTDNKISYTLRIQAVLELSSSDMPNQTAVVPLDDNLTIYSNPFACLPPEPAPVIDYFNAMTFVLGGNEKFEVEIKKQPSGPIAAGTDFTLETEVRHRYEGSGNSQVGANWQLKYGRFEISQLEDTAVTPRRVVNLPEAATVAEEKSWKGQARFRCMESGSAEIGYTAFVHFRWPWTADGSGIIAMPVNARAKVECTDAPDETISIFALPEADVIGPFTHQVQNNYGAFIVRWWRRPATDRPPVGTPVTVRVEVENLRIKSIVPDVNGAPAPWSLHGKLFTMGGTGLEPQQYPEAPAYAQSMRAHSLWSGDYSFICQNRDIAVLRHEFRIEAPFAMNLPSLPLVITDPGLICVAGSEPPAPNHDGGMAVAPPTKGR
jgi:hypothetical protein